MTAERLGHVPFAGEGMPVYSFNLNMSVLFVLSFSRTHSIAYIVEGKRVFSSSSISNAFVTLARGIGSDAAAEWIARAINR